MTTAAQPRADVSGEDAERRGEVFVYESPDLPGQWVARDAVTGVVSQGDSRAHALAMLAEALALHAGEALPTGEAAPGARTVDAVARDHGFTVKFIAGSLYSDALGDRNGPAGTYIGMVTHNIDAIVAEFPPEQIESARQANIHLHRPLGQRAE